MSKNKKTSAAAAAAQTKDPMFGKKILLTVIVFIVAAAVIAGTLVYVNYKEPELSEVTNTTTSPDTSSATIKNGGFDFVLDANKTGVPYAAQAWALSRRNNSVTVAGIVPTDEAEWLEVSKQLGALGVAVSNPGTPEASEKEKNDDKDTKSVYMIHNRAASYANIKNNTSFSVSSNSYSKITVWIKTVGVHETASEVYLRIKSSSSQSSDFPISVSAINTNGEWRKYTFYIEGQASKAQSLWVEVGLGENNTEGYDNATGTVFIDDVVLSSTSKGEYKSYVNNETDFIKTASFYSESDNIENKAEMNVEGFEPISVAQFMQENDIDLYPFSDDDEIYKLVNDGSSKSVGGSLINPVTVNHPSNGTHYRISFYVRTKDIRVDKGANIYLYDVENKNDNTYTTYFSKVRAQADAADDSFNGWVRYSFYIKPSNVRDFTLQLEMWLGNMINPEGIDEAVTGTLYVTEISVEEITMSDYSGASSGSQSKKVDLSSSSFTPQGSSTLTNGSFDSFATNVPGSVYPYAVSDWSAVTSYGVGQITYGIVVNDDSRNENLPVAVTAGDFAFNNAGIISQLYINNNSLASFGISSSKITLEANGYYRISVTAKELGGKAYVYLTGDVEAEMSYAGISASELSSYSSDKIELANGFVQFNFYVATGSQAKTVYLHLYNGKRGSTDDADRATGAVVFDMADYVKMTEDEFKALSAESEDEIQVFDSYDRKQKVDGKLVEKIELKSRFSNVVGFDFVNEQGDTRENPPSDTDGNKETKGDYQVNWLTIVLSAASLLMIAAVVYVVVVIVKRNKKR